MQSRSFVGSNPFVGNYFKFYLLFHSNWIISVIFYLQSVGDFSNKMAQEPIFYSKFKSPSFQMMNAKTDIKMTVHSRKVQSFGSMKHMSFVLDTQMAVKLRVTVIQEVPWCCPSTRMANFHIIKSELLHTGMRYTVENSQNSLTVPLKFFTFIVSFFNFSGIIVTDQIRQQCLPMFQNISIGLSANCNDHKTSGRKDLFWEWKPRFWCFVFPSCHVGYHFEEVLFLG